MIRGVLLGLVVACACGRARGVSDEELGGLVVEPKQREHTVDVARAATDPAALGVALMRPHRHAIAALGPHALTIESTTKVEEAGKVVEDLSERTTLELGDASTFHGLYTNTADYGREVTYVGGALYLRPRYQRWHKRAPESTDEPMELSDRFVEPVGATWDLLAPAVDLVDGGAADIDGRKGRKILIKLSPRPRKPAPETLTQRKWREQRTVEAVEGEVILDAASGAPLAVKLAGTIGFMRDGRRFRMATSVTSATTQIGTASVIATPAETEVVATPERLREVDERDYLLQGIAPPLRKNPDGTAITPTLPNKRGEEPRR